MVGRQFGVWTVRGAMLAGLVGSLLSLGGCASVLTGVYGTPPEDPAKTAVDTPAGPVRIDFDPDTECPQINIPNGGSYYGNSKTSQVVISNFARECDLSGPTSVTVKIGVEGHAVVASGGGGSYSAPLRITIRDRDEHVVYTKLIRVSTSMNQDGVNSFKIVDTSDPITIGLEKPLSSYEILVGFEGKGMATPAGKKKRRG
jgi:hypothetical protein